MHFDKELQLSVYQSPKKFRNVAVAAIGPHPNRTPLATARSTESRASSHLVRSPRATNVLALRCINASHRLDAFWQEHLDFKANLNSQPLKSAA